MNHLIESVCGLTSEFYEKMFEACKMDETEINDYVLGSYASLCQELGRLLMTDDEDTEHIDFNEKLYLLIARIKGLRDYASKHSIEDL
jgi:hypothetical protein